VKKALTFDAVREIGLKLPSTEAATSWGSPCLKVDGRMFCCIAINKSAEPNSLALRCDFAVRDELIEEQPDIYYTADHYLNYPCVLVRLSRVHRDALRVEPAKETLAHHEDTTASEGDKTLSYVVSAFRRTRPPTIESAA
jgi:hypothetical protein